MKTFAYAVVTTVAIAVSAGSASAGGWKNSGYDSGGKTSLINVSPTIDLRGVANGAGVLNNSAVASGNVLKGILSNNNTSLTGNLLGSVTNLLGNKKKR
jgi:hypothetical protein